MDFFQCGIVNSHRDGYSFFSAHTSVFDAHIAQVGVDVRTDIHEPFLIISDDNVSYFLQSGVFFCEFDQWLLA